MKRIDIIPNKKFVKNMSDELLEELINIKEAIPSEIMSMVMHYKEHDINSLRDESVGDDEELIDAEREERAITYSMEPLKANNYSSNFAIRFVNTYPQFSPMIKEVRTVEV